ncbi:hypothetical protein MMC25_005879 [Agyrium rufum]|nr:hypothetical protein [Agyrium rufum]
MSNPSLPDHRARPSNDAPILSSLPEHVLARVKAPETLRLRQHRHRCTSKESPSSAYLAGPYYCSLRDESAPESFPQPCQEALCRVQKSLLGEFDATRSSRKRACGNVRRQQWEDVPSVVEYFDFVSSAMVKHQAYMSLFQNLATDEAFQRGYQAFMDFGVKTLTTAMTFPTVKRTPSQDEFVKQEREFTQEVFRRNEEDALNLLAMVEQSLWETSHVTIIQADCIRHEATRHQRYTEILIGIENSFAETRRLIKALALENAGRQAQLEWAAVRKLKEDTTAALQAKKSLLVSTAHPPGDWSCEEKRRHRRRQETDGVLQPAIEEQMGSSVQMACGLTRELMVEVAFSTMNRIDGVKSVEGGLGCRRSKGWRRLLGWTKRSGR